MEKKVVLICTYCNLIFEKEAKEYRRQINAGRNVFYCSRSCACKQKNLDNPPKGNIINFKGKQGRSKDEYTPFKYFIRRAKYRSNKKGYGCNLTAEFLKNLWDQQNGICPFTGWKLILPQDSSYAWSEKNIHNASVDRIDNSKGYIEGNVRFIAFMANLARQSFEDEQLIEFCKAVAKKDLL